MRSRVMHLVMLVCVRSTYVYIANMYIMSTKNRLFSALPLENLLLSVICCLLFDFKCLQFCLLLPASCTDRAIHVFQIRQGGPLAPKFLCYNSFDVMHVCRLACTCAMQNTSNYSLGTSCMCSTLN